MKTIVVLIDSLNRHDLECYADTPVRTPNISRLAERGCVFANHFIGSAPCMPARRELLTGRQEFLWRGWGHLEPWDRNLAVEARAAGVVTQMVTDHYHYWESGAHNYFEQFDAVEFIRGNEFDLWKTDPVDELPAWAQRIEQFRTTSYGGRYRNAGKTYYNMARNWQTEADFPCAQVFRQSAAWLERNHTHDNFLLWAESFSPHEPFYVPEPYRSMYVARPPAQAFNCWPPYQVPTETERFIRAASDEELAWTRAQYHGNVTMVDRWLGELFDRMDALDLWDDTAVILTTDHGHDLCYNRLDGPTTWGKAYPHPESHARIPLIVWHPQQLGRGREIDALTCAVDVNATLREVMGVPDHDGPHGRSLLPLVRGDATAHREYLLYGTFGEGATVSDDAWTLALGSRQGAPLHWYSSTGLRVSPDMVGGHFIPGVPVPQWRVPTGHGANIDYLWRRQPFTVTPDNLVEREPAAAARMKALMRQALAESQAPEETYARLGLQA